MIVHDVVQGSVPWHRCRAGIVTASELDKIISPLGKIRTGDTPDGYLARKLAERWLGRPVESGSSWAMDQGSLREIDVIAQLENHLNVDIERPGFITTDDGGFGCSPDGLIGGECGVEAKCPQPENHMRHLIGGKVPTDYIMQVQGSMAVMGLDSWYFTSKCPDLPWFLLKVGRDEKLIASILDAVEQFNERLGTEWDQLVKAHGEPKRSVPVVAMDDPESPF